MRPRLERSWLVAGALALSSCRGCLETDVTFAEGSGGGPSSTSAGTLTGTGGSASSGSADCPASDSFPDGTQSPCWSEMSVADVADLSGPDAPNGNYLAFPRAASAWWQGDDGVDETGWFLYQSVRGAFAVSVHIQTTADSGRFQMAGLQLRDPGASEESWIQWQTGRRGDPETAPLFGSLAAANTRNDIAREIPPPQMIDVDFLGRLGICRDGDHYFLGHSPDIGAVWEIDHEFSAPLADPVSIPTLPDEIQLGLIAGVRDDASSLTVRFNDFVISTTDPVGTPNECIAALERHGTFQ